VAEDSADAVTSVLQSWGRRRGVTLIRRFEHGVGGTSLVEIDGSRRVLKAWPLRGPGSESQLERSLQLAEIMRRRGAAVPALLERGQAAGCGFLVYEYLDGEWSAELGPGAIAEIATLIELARGAAPAPNTAWAEELETMVQRGDPSFDIDPAALSASRAATAVLIRARRRLAACDPSDLRTSDIVHGDFAPENLLIRDDQVVGVVDWERARVGDAGLDLVGAIFDIEIGEKASPPLRQEVWGLAREQLPATVLAAYVGVYAVRYLSWSVGTDMEDEVLELVADLLRRSEVGGSSRGRAS